MEVNEEETLVVVVGIRQITAVIQQRGIVEGNKCMVTVYCNSKDCQWHDGAGCMKEHITVEEGRCLDFAVKKLSIIT